MRARVRVRMVTDSGQREGVRGCRTGERTAGQQDSRRHGQREQVVQGTAGGREDRTAGDSETGGQQNGRTKERTSTVIVMQ